MAEDVTKIPVYKGKHLGDLFREIHANVIVKQGKIEELVAQLMPLIKTPQDALEMVPMIKDYLDVGVRNDELLVKVAAIVQRYASSTAKKSDGDDSFLTDEDKQKLLDEAQDYFDKSKDGLEDK